MISQPKDFYECHIIALSGDYEYMTYGKDSPFIDYRLDGPSFVMANGHERYYIMDKLPGVRSYVSKCVAIRADGMVIYKAAFGRSRRTADSNMDRLPMSEMDGLYHIRDNGVFVSTKRPDGPSYLSINGFDQYVIDGNTVEIASNGLICVLRPDAPTDVL